MEYKERTKPVELGVLEILKTRMDLSEKAQQHYYNLKKGYEGEVAFDELTRKLQCDCLVLNDLLLQVGSTTFQIDTLIIADKLYLFDVKNHDGDYYHDGDRIYNKGNHNEISNPINQLIRAESLLRQLLHPLGVTTNISSSVVFINPEFTLYQAPLDKPIILPTQVHRYLKHLNSIRSRITNRHRALADKLISLHLAESPFSQLPEYTYEDLKKGIACRECSSLQNNVTGHYCICKNCGFKESVDDAMVRTVREYQLLFPGQKITTNIVYDMCKIIPSKIRVSRTLGRNFKHVWNNRWSYFE